MAEQHFNVLVTVIHTDGQPWTKEQFARFLERQMPVGFRLRVDEVHDDTVDPEDRQPGAGSAYGMEAERG